LITTAYPLTIAGNFRSGYPLNPGQKIPPLVLKTSVPGIEVRPGDLGKAMLT
jgi:hypothetical protein